jgi:hypothetical protein
MDFTASKVEIALNDILKDNLRFLLRRILIFIVRHITYIIGFISFLLYTLIIRSFY